MNLLEFLQPCLSPQRTLPRTSKNRTQEGTSRSTNP
uniref:Uncharacterized protein n=1 Tax=Anguilla anguilla TaxID=7936 RepID=A0A0E9WDN9_ANGAN